MAKGRKPAFVVALGGSAGGLEALEQFFAHVPATTGMAFVVITHMDPDHKALLAELIQRTTAMPVREATDGQRVARDHVYVIPPNRELTIAGDVLKVAASRRGRSRTPIDAFFESLAAARGATAIGIVLSGMGSDGARGLRAIKAAGGAALVQAPETAGFDAMPLAAIAAGAVDAVAAADELPTHLAARAPAAAGAPSGNALARITEILRARTGHDLGHYKSTAVERRLERRLSVHRLADLDAYASYLEANPGEAEILFHEVLIGVTRFFRDAGAFAVLADQVLPQMLEAKRAPRRLRAWVAGCSTGEEAYSLAIVVHEVIARLGLRDVAVQIYATDLDSAAIARARTGIYPAEVAGDLSAERLAAAFTRDDHGYRIKKEIRESVIFAQHDLIVDPPFTRLDLISCRNVLIYLQPEVQRRLLARFHYALGPGGALVLGTSETAASAEALFATIDGKAKIFRARAGAGATAARTGMTAPELPGPPRRPASPAAREPSLVEAAQRAILDGVAPPTLLVNDRGDVLYASRRTGRYLEPAVGKTNVNVFAMAREGLGPHLGLALRRAIADGKPTTQAGVLVQGERGKLLVDVRVVPLDEPAPLRGLLLIVFEDAPPPAKQPRRAGGRKRPLEVTALERELGRAERHLEIVVREMEASKAQLGTTNEELQSTNEELQSTNEELTTSKEELQSLNEELLTLNAELQVKNDELAMANDDLRNLLNSTQIPTLFLDNQLRLKRFTTEARRIAKLIAADVGRPITDLALELDYDGIVADVEEVLRTLVSKEIQVAAKDSTYTMRIHPYRTMDNKIDGVVITFFDVTALRRAEEALAAHAHEETIARLLDRWPGMVYIHDLDLARDVYLNDSARHRLRVASRAGKSFSTLFHAADAAESGRWGRRLAALRDDEVVTRIARVRGARGVYERFVDRVSVLSRSPSGAVTRILRVLEKAQGR